MTKLNADQLKKLKAVIPQFTEPCIQMRGHYNPNDDDAVRHIHEQVKHLLRVLKVHDLLIIQTLEAYAELDDELMTAQDTIADLEEALNEALGVVKIDERERPTLLVQVPLE